MQQDSLKTVIRDTIFITEKKIDTIYKVVNDTIYIAQENDIINAYQKTIDAQASTYNIIITVFLGLVALFAGATWWYNRKAAKSEITEEVHKIFEKEKADFLAGQKLEFQNELHIQRAESARLFALYNLSIISNTEDDQEKFNAYANLVYWWNEVFMNNFIAGNNVGARLGIDSLANSLQRIISEKLEKEFFNAYKAIYNYSYLFDSLEYIHDSLIYERNKIKDYLNQIASKNDVEVSNNETKDEEKNN